ncbi:hypothetical protein ACFLIM_32380 [Nonomuraea sp. M3C6]|uniref:Uncharacterized protein n=1 Tax=Nonomuraea marmarensis TaxID=3351344 RepID=A0ABW7AKL1_9ACTN
MSFEIRAALPEDSATIEAVRIATWRVAYREVMPAAFLTGLQVRPEVVRGRSESLARGRASGMVAVRATGSYAASADPQFNAPSTMHAIPPCAPSQGSLRCGK